METDLLIVGCGPFGLSLAAKAQQVGIDFVMVGKTMGFWTDHMPEGMVLRSGCDWHLDPVGQATIEAYLETIGSSASEAEPLSRDTYLAYTAWFIAHKGLTPLDLRVQHLERRKNGLGFNATTDSGEAITARYAALALGFEHFAAIPPEMATMFPARRSHHTCERVDLDALAGRRCLLIGGRQSAFEWAALLAEAGAHAVHVVHRHPTPVFEQSDWSWVDPLLDELVTDPDRFRLMPEAERRALAQRFWAEGRLKLEPWLGPRIAHDAIRLWPNDTVIRCEEHHDGALAVDLHSGATLDVDEVIFATGYQPDAHREPLLADTGLVDNLATPEGHLLLDSCLQTRTPGLFVTSMAAAPTFGAFFAFTVASRASAELIARGLTAA